MRLLLSALVALGLGSSVFAADKSVTSLTASTFPAYVESHDLALIEFFAPWCGHCKKLAPEYENAAKQLQADNIHLAAVDCTADKDLCSEYNVTGFPTLKIFRGSASAPGEYGGGRTAPEIVKYMKKQQEPSYVTVSDSASLSSLVTGTEGVLLLGVFPTSDSDAAKAFIKTAEALRNEHKFAFVHDVNLVTVHAPTAVTNSIVLLKDSESDPSVTQSVVFNGPFDSTSISNFIKAESFPLVGEIGPENFQKYVDRGFPLVWIFVANDSPLTTPTLNVARAVASHFKDSLSLVHLDGVKWAEHAKHFGLVSGELPGIVLEDRENGKNYIFPFSQEVTESALKKFFDGYKDGTLQPNLKSQEIPSYNDAPVTTVVGKSFDQIVMDDSKDVLVEFYAPWCGHCKSLAPKYEKLGEMFADNEKVVIAQVDATENDTPAKIKGFPTLILYRAGDKSHPLTYEGERTEDALAEWLRKNGNTFKDGSSSSSSSSSDHGHAHDHHGHAHDDL